MGNMGLMNSKDALGKDQHNCWAHLRIAKKDASQGWFKELFSTMVACFTTELENEKGSYQIYYEGFTHAL